MSNKFIAEYLQTCAKQGITSVLDIKKRAEQEIKSLEKEINQALLKKEQVKNLHAVIKGLGGEQQEAEKVMDFSLSEEELTTEFRNLCISVCDMVEQSEEGVPPSIIIHDLVSITNHSSGYQALQWLSSRNIIVKNSDKKIVIGDNWESRPRA